MARNTEVLEKNFSEPATFRQCKAFAYACQEIERVRTGKKDPKIYQEVFGKVWKEQKEGTLTKGECSELIDHARNGGTVPEKFFKPSPPKPTPTDEGDWLTSNEVAKLCNMGRSRMYRLIRLKQFPPSHSLPRTSLQRGRSLMRWKVEEVEEWLKTSAISLFKKESQTTKPQKSNRPRRDLESLIKTLIIEDDVPIPPVRPLITSPFVELKVDQSFFVPSDPKANHPRYVGIEHFRKEYPRRKIVQRVRVENGVKGHRYWRTK